MPTTPISLIQRLRLPAADEADWSRFVSLYSPLFFYWGRKKMGLSLTETEDLVQEVMLLVVGKIGEFEHRHCGSFRAWLRTITLNKCRDRLRRRQPTLIQADVGAVLDRDDADDAALFTDEEYRVHLAHRALELMQGEFQQTTWKACWMVVVEERSAREVSEELGISVNAVYLARSRVLKRLREELHGLWDE